MLDTLGIGLVILLPQAPQLAPAPKAVEVLDGPTVLHSNIQQQWGGHTFSYLIEGNQGVFWSAIASRAGPALVGQFPLPGSSLPVRVRALPQPDGKLERVIQPQMVRTPDGYLHVFVGYEPEAKNRGGVLYLRSRRPEDVSEFVDRTELIPTEEYSTFAAPRKNVGITRDGSRIALVALTAFKPNHYLRNTPLLFVGERKGLDFEFRPPIAFAEPLHFFYPHVAATEHGPVLLASVTYEPARHAELVHLDWEGRVLLWEKLPRTGDEANTSCYELEPLTTDSWSRMILVRTIVPGTGDVRRIEFWEYDAARRELTRRRELVNDIRQELSYTNAGRILVAPGKPALFLNEPASKAVYAWEGDLLGSGPLRVSPLPCTTVSELGFSGIRSLFLPSVLQGSVPHAGTRAVAMDVDCPSTRRGETGPCALLMWRIRY